MRRIEDRKYNVARAAGLLAIMAAGVVAGCADQGGQHTVAASITPAATSPAKETATGLLDLDGKPFDLRGSSKGRVHVVVFTRSDCPVSNRFAPEVRGLYDKFHPLGVDFYLIYVDPRQKPEAIREHLGEFEYPCPGLRDPKHVLVKQIGAKITPEAFVFDRGGNIAYRGRINNQYEDFGKSRAVPSKHDLQEAIEATLVGRPVAEPVTKAIGCYIDDLK
jgi:hypothetical protein